MKPSRSRPGTLAGRIKCPLRRVEHKEIGPQRQPQSLSQLPAKRLSPVQRGADLERRAQTTVSHHYIVDHRLRGRADFVTGQACEVRSAFAVLAAGIGAVVRRDEEIL